MDSVKFHPAHLEIMEFREEEKNGILACPGISKYLETLALIGSAVTVFHEGKILLCGGCFPVVVPGVLEFWQVPSIYILDDPIRASRFAKNFIEEAIAENKAYRAQTTCPDDALHARWAKFLEFEKEGVLKHAGANKSHLVQYGRIF